MKKVISLVLVVALFAALAISASAAVVPHYDGFDPLFNWMWMNDPSVQGLSSTTPATTWNLVWQDTQVLSITEGVGQTFTSCKQAITADELQGIVDANDYGIKNLTVFRQRNVVGAEGEVELTVKLWPCAPTKRPAHATVVLFRAEGEETWSVVGYAADKVCDAVLPGNGAYVVCLAW